MPCSSVTLTSLICPLGLLSFNDVPLKIRIIMMSIKMNRRQSRPKFCTPGKREGSVLYNTLGWECRFWNIKSLQAGSNQKCTRRDFFNNRDVLGFFTLNNRQGHFSALFVMITTQQFFPPIVPYGKNLLVKSVYRSFACF